MAGEASCALDKASCALDEDSRDTLAATEGARPLGKSTVPVFVAAMPSQEEKDELGHEEDDVDEEETQIRMTNSEEQERAPRLERKIVEETVPLPILSAVSSASRSVGDTGMENSDGDFNMSDDMLPEIAALFRQREEKQEVVQNRIYTPRTSFRSSQALTTRNNSDSSGGETEIEGEPAEKSPVKSKVETSNSPVFQDRLPRLAKSASCLTITVQEDTSGPERKTEKTPNSTLLSGTLKRDQREASDGSHVKTKRSRHDEDVIPLQCSDQISSLENPEKKNEDDQHKSPQVADEITLDISEDKRSRSDEVKEAWSHSASTVPRKSPTSGKYAKVTDSESTGSQSEGGSIRVILTGLEPTAAIRKRIKSITDANYESNIEKATHVVAPQNQLKRTVKLLCGISCCTHILGKRWLDQSARAGAAVDEQANCLHDEEAESKWQFDLRRTMYDVSSKQRQRVYHQPQVRAATGEGSSENRGVRGREGLANANPEQIYSPELILSSVLQQRVELDKHRLKLPAIGKSWATECWH
ncbi:unnamed protein product [Peronospora destructor]|uniref:BRCT domain-containing protein n=1 Tax=Peronospora destructor TaxID=86335 RepID=A0AAV0TU50_9STRA|nr:unnamed protein product [Peronospora destructor]